jgi:hypothetical protein
MPVPRNLVALDTAAIKTIPGLKTVSKLETSFVKSPMKAAAFKAANTNWIRSIQAPKVAQPKPGAIKAVAITAADVTKLAAVSKSTSATAEILAQGLGPDQTLGLLYSSIVAYEYTKLKAERKKRSTVARTKAKTDAEWGKVVEAVAAGYSAAGLKGLKEADLDKMATELGRNKANFNAVATIANSVEDSLEAVEPKVLGGFLTHVAVIPDLVAEVTTAPSSLCTTPIQGNFTKHFSRSFALKVRLYVPCPSWTNPFRWCWKTFTIASVSFSLDLSVGYRVTCCGATAWGQAAAQACGSIVGVSVCATCTAKIVGVAGVGRTGSGSSCSYGLGINAELKCTLAGATVLYLSVPFGWTITGPCPPASLPC